MCAFDVSRARTLDRWPKTDTCVSLQSMKQETTDDRIRAVILTARSPREIGDALGMSRSWVYWWLSSLSVDTLIDLRAHAIEGVEAAQQRVLADARNLDAVELTTQLRAIPDPWLLRTTSQAGDPNAGMRQTRRKNSKKKKRATPKPKRRVVTKRSTSRGHSSRSSQGKKGAASE